jgi:hypothetical protein
MPFVLEGVENFSSEFNCLQECASAEAVENSWRGRTKAFETF